MKGLCCILCLLSAPCWAALPDGSATPTTMAPAEDFAVDLRSQREQVGERLLTVLGLNRLLPQWRWQHRNGKGDTKLRLQLEPDGEVALKMQLRW